MHWHNALILQMTELRLRIVNWTRGSMNWSSPLIPFLLFHLRPYPGFKSTSPRTAPGCPRHVQPPSRCWKDGPESSPGEEEHKPSHSSLSRNLRGRAQKGRKETDPTNAYFMPGTFAAVSHWLLTTSCLNLLQGWGLRGPLRIPWRLRALFPR